jgi:hypothetical protein
VAGFAKEIDLDDRGLNGRSGGQDRAVREKSKEGLHGGVGQGYPSVSESAGAFSAPFFVPPKTEAKSSRRTWISP